MATENKTKPTEVPVQDYLNGISEKRKADIQWIYETMSSLTGLHAHMWGTTMVGFDTYHYKYESGREGDFFRIGFSSRKQNIVLYIISGFQRFDELMGQLGKFKTGKSCLYINKLEDIDKAVLKELMKESYAYMNKKYPKL